MIVFCVCSRANMEHVAAVREPGGLQRAEQSCQIRFRPLTARGSGEESLAKMKSQRRCGAGGERRSLAENMK